jgi:molecular chaperone GrpE (heat shock protein)
LRKSGSGSEDEHNDDLPHASTSTPQKSGEGAAAAGGEGEEEEVEEEEEDDYGDAKATLDSGATIKSLRADIDEQQLRLKQERARKMKVYEKQLDREYKDGMKRVLKKMLLQYHPDKINTLRAGEAPIEGTEEEVEAYLKDITQELARIMHSYGGE